MWRYALMDEQWALIEDLFPPERALVGSHCRTGKSSTGTDPS